MLVPSATLAWGNPELLAVVNGQNLTKKDFIDWWGIWKEEETPLPETPDDFIDWILLVQEAENMQLYDRPNYQNKVEVFLKVRTLMMLKYDEVDSKISPPTREELWAVYERDYLPRLNLRLVSVETDESRQRVEDTLAGGAGVEVAAEKAGLLDTPGYLPETGLMRPDRLPAPLLEAVRTMSSGEMGGPVDFEHYSYFFEILERDDGNEEDFATLHRSLTKKWKKEQESRLTAELLARLRTKYNVEIHDDVVDQIGVDPLDPKLAEKVAFSIGDLHVQAKSVHKSLVSDYNLRYGYNNGKGADLADLRNRLINGMIGQSLSGIEALDRRYEKKAPLRKTYRYYCQNRMIKELEQELIAQQIELSDEDIDAAYRENMDMFIRTGMVEIEMVQTREEELARIVEKELQQGRDFLQATAPIAPLGPKSQRVPVDHLDPPIKAALADLAPGQASKMISVGEEYFFVKLLKQDDRQAQPLEMVREKVKADLGQRRFREARQELLSQLRERSTIKVKKKAWKQVVEQLEKEQNESPEQ